MAAEGSAYTEIGAFDAKTRLSELLRKVDQESGSPLPCVGERWHSWCQQSRNAMPPGWPKR